MAGYVNKKPTSNLYEPGEYEKPIPYTLQAEADRVLHECSGEAAVAAWFGFGLERVNRLQDGPHAETVCAFTAPLRY